MSPLATVVHRAAISGFVRDAITGDGLAGAVVRLTPGTRQARSDDEGFYSFIDLADGNYQLSASVPGLGSRYGSLAAVTVTVARDAAGRPQFDRRSHLDLPPTQLSGMVQRLDNNAPIADAEIQLPAGRRATRSARDGRYSLVAVEAGSQTLRVSAPGYASTSQQVSLLAGQTTVVDLGLITR